MTRKSAFFEGWSWSKFNKLGLTLGTNLSVKTKIQTVLGANSYVCRSYSGKNSLKKLQNSILHTILVWSLFYSIRVYTILYFLCILLKNYLSLLCFFVFSACSKFNVMFINFCKVCIITIFIVDVKYSVFLFSFITSQLNNL